MLSHGTIISQLTYLISQVGYVECKLNKKIGEINRDFYVLAGRPFVTNIVPCGSIMSTPKDGREVK